MHANERYIAFFAEHMVHVLASLLHMIVRARVSKMVDGLIVYRVFLGRVAANSG